MANIKRFMQIMLCAALLCVLAACSLIQEVPTLKSKPAPNTIAPKELTEEEDELIRLLSGSEQEIYLFSYHADPEYRQLDLWVEIYKDGILVEPSAGGLGIIFEETDEDLTGTIAVTITQTPDYRWRFAHKNESSVVSSTTEPNPNYLPEAIRSYHQILRPQTIEPDKEVLLYQSVFGAHPPVISTQTLLESPELIKTYDYVHLIKCRFSAASEN